MIKGGYYIKARIISESDIAHAPPHFREIWDWILKEVNHTDTTICKKGECIRSYKDIINGLSWNIGYRKMSYTKSQCENAMKYLLKHTMIATTKTTRGLKITVINWDKYQNPENYERRTSATTKDARVPQQRHTINNNKNKDNKDNKYSKLENLTETEFQEISNRYNYPLAFVRSKYDDLINWHEKNPQKNFYKNYLFALRDWVKRDALKVQQDYGRQNQADDVAIIKDLDNK